MIDDKPRGMRQKDFLQCGGVEVVLTALKQTISSSQQHEAQEQQQGSQEQLHEIRTSDSARAAVKHAESACGAYAPL